MGNPHTSERLTEREQTNPGHHAQSPENLSEKAKTKSESKTYTDKTTPYSQTLHNPDKPEKSTDTQTSKDNQQSEDSSSTDTSGIRLI